jgi:hypothetical protein
LGEIEVWFVSHTLPPSPHGGCARVSPGRISQARTESANGRRLSGIYSAENTATKMDEWRRLNACMLGTNMWQYVRLSAVLWGKGKEGKLGTVRTPIHWRSLALGISHGRWAVRERWHVHVCRIHEWAQEWARHTLLPIFIRIPALPNSHTHGCPASCSGAGNDQPGISVMCVVCNEFYQVTKPSMRLAMRHDALHIQPTCSKE